MIEGVSPGPRCRVTEFETVKHGIDGIEGRILLSRVDQNLVADEFQSLFLDLFFF